ncbi:metallophosphoesterase [Anoxynatronum sibiricum]|uniref:Metallophosphoesterase n=1 Tax=Anoxynatronum sibiricum TaxID=210623 RepID=A0ABU9VTU6_9CLOT
MKWSMIPLVALLLAIYTALNYYIGLRGLQAFGHLLGPRGMRMAWALYWLVVYLYMAARLLGDRLPSNVVRRLIHAGAYWMAAMVYLLMFLIVIDLIRAAAAFIPLTFHQPLLLRYWTGLLVVGLVLGVLIYGTWNARNPRRVDYQVAFFHPLAQEAATATDGEMQSSLRVALVSDIHLGTIVGSRRLEKLVEQLNEMAPDMILFAGDIIDENVNHFIDERMDETFRRLNPPLGTYAVLGNHEYFGGHLEDIVHHLQASGMKVLRDERVLVADRFYLAGREDVVSERFTGTPRKPLRDILDGIDPATTPVLLMDHQPKDWQEARVAGVRLQVSGHTHRGQMFPFGFITERLFDEDWGKLQEGDQTLIVSSGYGTWGPPVRTGNQPEIVLITLVERN